MTSFLAIDSLPVISIVSQVLFPVSMLPLCRRDINGGTSPSRRLTYVPTLFAFFALIVAIHQFYSHILYCPSFFFLRTTVERLTKRLFRYTKVTLTSSSPPISTLWRTYTVRSLASSLASPVTKTS